MHRKQNEVEIGENLLGTRWIFHLSARKRWVVNKDSCSVSLYCSVRAEKCRSLRKSH